MNLNRRELLKSCATSAVSLAAVQPHVFAGMGSQPIRVGVIGCGWYGKTDLLHLLQVTQAEVVGLCDVDSKMLADAAELVTYQFRQKKPRTFPNYRDLLSEEKPDVVIIGTPDHWHCLPMVEACKAGCDVYVQKPISWDVVEGQAMVAAARKYKRTVQVGLQRRSTPHLLEARKKFIDSGMLGKIAFVDIHSYYSGRPKFSPPKAPPESIDWDAYVGPAAWVDYREGIHPRRWRSFREFGNGQTGDLCVHFLDLIRYFLKLGWPQRISASGGILMGAANSPVNTHDTQMAIFDYEDVQVVWNQRNWGTNPEPEYPWGATLYGEKGTLKLSVWKYEFTPKGKGEPVRGVFLDEREKFPEDLQHKETEVFAAPATRRHMQDFLQEREGDKKPVADIEEGHISTACCILANLSMELRRSLAWDSAAGKVRGDEEANQRLAGKYRGDWVHPTPDSI